ncbi:acyl carrier protein [Cyanobacterium sp. Dongsha4]|uniref:acyl carrier protein n=1 Tax=Cyanobacterium sp. DS4 TaxID=2878255 RepID=UPI002E81E861|nr:acyl carrier protein [Cyanobacterium sp. Dongsha4]WVL00562.1 acyl carrier protein [Cyanobacterium sp. Dongsha4]
MNQEIFDKVKKIVVERLAVNPSEVTPNTNFANDLGADSLNIVELVMALEEQFGVEFTEEAAETIDTVGKAVEYIESQ